MDTILLAISSSLSLKCQVWKVLDFDRRIQRFVQGDHLSRPGPADLNQVNYDPAVDHQDNHKIRELNVWGTSVRSDM